ncbi:hypothetical protein ACFL6S_09180 [Candidatus Poribacteria bacterium]
MVCRADERPIGSNAYRYTYPDGKLTLLTTRSEGVAPEARRVRFIGSNGSVVFDAGYWL